MKRRYRKNAMTSDDLLHLGIAAVTAFGIGMILGRKQGAAETATVAGLGAYYRNHFTQPISGLGEYFREPLSGRGGNYISVR